MSTRTGLLLINAGGEVFFVEDGILVGRLGDNTTIGEVDPDDPEFRNISDLKIPDSQLKAYEETVRKERELQPRTYNPSPDVRPGMENLGPILFQAFNVEIETSDAGDSEITGNSTGIESG